VGKDGSKNILKKIKKTFCDRLIKRYNIIEGGKDLNGNERKGLQISAV
jgi:hypothetical protein